MAHPGTDPLAHLAHDLIKAATYEKLVVRDSAPAEALRLLQNLTPDQLLSAPVVSSSHAWAMLAGLWLWHDALDECHRIAQQSPQDLHSAKPVESARNVDPRSLRDATESLAFWHAIMHRREGDFSNSKYWYARCPNHPVLKSMASHGSEILHPLPANKSLLRILRNGWDPSALVDLAEEVHDQPNDPRYRAAVILQKTEWRALFDYCTRQAAGL